MLILTAYIKKRVVDGSGRAGEVREGSGVGKSFVIGTVKLRSAQSTLQALISSSGTTTRWIERVTPAQLADATFPYLPISDPAEFGVVANDGSPIDVKEIRDAVEGDETEKDRAVLYFFLSQFGVPETAEAYSVAARSVSFLRNTNRELGPASVVGRPIQAPYYRTCTIDGQRYHVALAVCTIPCFVGCLGRSPKAGGSATGMTFQIEESAELQSDVAYAINRDAMEARKFRERFAAVRCIQIVDVVVSDTILSAPRTFTLPVTRSAEANPYWFNDVVSAKCVETPYADTERAGRLRSSMDNYLTEKIIELLYRRVGDNMFYISAADLDDLGVFEPTTVISVSRVYELYNDGLDQALGHFADYGYANQAAARLAMEQQVRWLVNRIREYRNYVNRSPFLDRQGQRLNGRMVTGSFPGGIPIDAKTFSRYWHGDHILETLARFVFSGSSAASSGGADVDFFQTTDELSAEFDGLEDYVERGLKDPVFAGSLTGIMGGRVGHAIIGHSGSHNDGPVEKGYLMPFLTSTSRATERDIEHLYIGLLKVEAGAEKDGAEEGKPKTVFFSYFLTAPGRCTLRGQLCRKLFLFKYMDTADGDRYKFGHRFIPWCVVTGKELTENWIVLQKNALFLGSYKEGIRPAMGEAIKIKPDLEVITDPRAVSVNHPPSRHETFSSEITLAKIEALHDAQVANVAALVTIACAEQKAFEADEDEKLEKLRKERAAAFNAKNSMTSRKEEKVEAEEPVEPEPPRSPSPAAPGAASSEERAARSLSKADLDMDEYVLDDDEALDALADAASSDEALNRAQARAQKQDTPKSGKRKTSTGKKLAKAKVAEESQSGDQDDSTVVQAANQASGGSN